MNEQQAAELVKPLTMVEARTLAEAVRRHMLDLRQQGMETLTKRLEEIAASEVGMSLSEMLAAVRSMQPKKGRGRPKGQTLEVIAGGAAE